MCACTCVCAGVRRLTIHQTMVCVSGRRRVSVALCGHVEQNDTYRNSDVLHFLVCGPRYKYVLDA